MHKDVKWAKQIISLQDSEGKWGSFHTLSQPTAKYITTEQALRRLERLGYTIEDECIQKAVSYMNDCLIGKKSIPDRREKVHDWDIFTSLMLSTWIRRFTKDSPAANKTAKQWADIISGAFLDGIYNHEEYVSAYTDILGLKPKGGRLIDFVSFYPVSLVRDCLDEKTEQAAVELLSKYVHARHKLNFVIDWLNDNRNEKGKWDMGKMVNDKVYFPLSDDWRKKETREADCTERITNLMVEIL